MTKSELFLLFQAKFKEQLGLELSDVVVLQEGKFVLKMELMALSIGSMKLQLSNEEHGFMASFLTQIQDDKS